MCSSDLFENYMLAKQKFFDMLTSDAFALANHDDENGAFMLQNTKAQKSFYGLAKELDGEPERVRFLGKLIANTFLGLKFEIDGALLETRMVGTFNVYNLLAVYGAAVLLKENPNNILAIMKDFAPPKGRFEHVEINGKVGIVDYAHTPEALRCSLEEIKRIHNEPLWCVFGCGGDRDKEKRPLMGAVAQEYSDHIVITNDNPRTEGEMQIINDILSGMDAQEIGRAHV